MTFAHRQRGVRIEEEIHGVPAVLERVIEVEPHVVGGLAELVLLLVEALQAVAPALEEGVPRRVVLRPQLLPYERLQLGQRGAALFLRVANDRRAPHEAAVLVLPAAPAGARIVAAGARTAVRRLHGHTP